MPNRDNINKAMIFDIDQLNLEEQDPKTNLEAESLMY
jgi:hypothetical protein